MNSFLNYAGCLIAEHLIVEYQFGYCPLVGTCHSRTLNNQINRLHERALHLVYQDPTV